MNPKERGNCFPTVIACIMDLDSAEDVLQFQELYKGVDEEEDSLWVDKLYSWLDKKNCEWYGLEGHQYDDSYYLVTGETERDTIHICIYQNGKLYHDPYPNGKGLTIENEFEYIGEINNIKLV